MHLNRIMRAVRSELLSVTRDTGARQDSIDDFLGEAQKAITRVLERSGLISIVRIAGTDISGANGKKYEKNQTYRSLGLDRRVPGTLIDNWVKNNVQLITNTTWREAQDMERLFRDTAFSGRRKAELEGELLKIFKKGRSNAELIAKDQTGKLFGQLDEYKQTSAGIPGYYWRTTLIPGRVRPQHAAREGLYFLWSQPPEGGHPGQAIRCMCEAEPAVDKILQ
jgi:SPP1 gp7 family putative phage head morphogenesis protein